MTSVTGLNERAYVQNWARAGRLLEDIRWRELSLLSDEAALRASEALLDAAVATPLPASRRQWSGLVHLQNWLHRRHRL